MAEPLVLLNYAFVAIVFSLLLGAGVSQKARVGLCWLAIPALMALVATKLLRTYDTVDELVFYASYHSHPMNQLVHIVCVPLLLFTVFVFAAYVPPPIKGLTWPLLGAVAWSVHHVRAAPLVGSLVSCLTFAMAFMATAVVERELRASFKPGDRVVVEDFREGPYFTVVEDFREGTVAKSSTSAVVEVERDDAEPEEEPWQGSASALRRLDGGQTSYGRLARYAGVIHIFCWYMQLHPGHGVFEGRKPALLDSVLQAFLDAPLFVWYEVAFACGYDPSLKQQLDAAVEARHVAWSRGDL